MTSTGFSHWGTGAYGARFLFALASLMMAGGIGMAAAAAHAGAGHEIGVAATVLLANAPMLAAAALALRLKVLHGAIGLGGSGLGIVGTVLFTADMAHRGFGHGALFENAAPIGGSIDILAFVILAIAALAAPRKM